MTIRLQTLEQATSIMKLSSDSTSSANLIRSYGRGFFIVNGERHDTSIILSPDRIRPCEGVRRIADIDSKVLAALSEWSPEVVLIGTGARHELPNAEFMGCLATLRTGVEVMRSDAACRTYNVLASEDRRVVALLMLIGCD